MKHLGLAAGVDLYQPAVVLLLLGQANQGALLADAGPWGDLGGVQVREEGMRQAEFPFIQFRDSGAGRAACVMGTRLLVWHVAVIARDYGGDAARVATHLDIPEAQVKSALAYAGAYRDEVDQAIADDE